MPLMNQGSGHHVALANWYSFIWRPIFGGKYDDATHLMLLRQLARMAKNRSRRLTLAPVPNEDGSARQLAAAFKAEGWFADMSVCDQNHYLRLGGRSFEQYWEARPGRLKNTVRRKSKAANVSIRIGCDFSESAWSDYEQVYARSWKPSEDNPDFLKYLARREASAGCLRLGLGYIDGEPVAGQFWTVENGTAFIHKLAHDERYLSASPGTLLQTAMFRHAIDIDKVREIDFGTGADTYKRDWMEETRPRYRIDLFRPGHAANWPLIARARLRHMRRNAD